MTASGAGAAAYARGHLRRAPRPFLRLALEQLDRTSLPAEVIADAWAAAGVGLAFAEILEDAAKMGGRSIVDVTFALHARLGLAASASPPEGLRLVALDPYAAWLERRTLPDSPWRRPFGRWIDLLNERLTLHRYTNPEHRSRHARDLLALPLLTLARAIDPAAEPSPALLQFCDRLLALWDLSRSAEHALHGWNRVAPPDPDRIGGFYGLSDEAVPPEPAALRAAAESLMQAFQAGPPPTLLPAFDPWLATLRSLAIDMLASVARGAAWPAGLGGQKTLIGRLARHLGLRGHT